MLTQYKTKITFGIGLGVVLKMLAFIIQKQIHEPNLFVGILELSSFISMIIGCAALSKAKGYHPLWGALGLLSILGAIILYFFPDKNRNENR